MSVHACVSAYGVCKCLLTEPFRLYLARPSILLLRIIDIIAPIDFIVKVVVFLLLSSLTV